VGGVEAENLMVRSEAKLRVSNHEAIWPFVLILRDARKCAPQDEVYTACCRDLKLSGS